MAATNGNIGSDASQKKKLLSVTFAESFPEYLKETIIDMCAQYHKEQRRHYKVVEEANEVIRKSAEAHQIWPKVSTKRRRMLTQCFVCICLLAIASAAPTDDQSSLEKREQMYEAMSEAMAPLDDGEDSFLRSFRSASNGKPTFIRFGKRAQPSFIRFGKRAQPSFIRFGRSANIDQ